jgi:hypothetical protein
MLVIYIMKSVNFPSALPADLLTDFKRAARMTFYAEKLLQYFARPGAKKAKYANEAGSGAARSTRLKIGTWWLRCILRL